MSSGLAAAPVGPAQEPTGATPASGARPEDAPPADVSPSAADPEASIYDRVFWVAFAAHFVLVMGNAITFTFAEFVRGLGGTEVDSGWLVMAGLVAAVAIRFVVSRETDRLGLQVVWTGGAIACFVGAVVMATAGSLAPLYVARVAFSCGLAVGFACQMAHIQRHVPDHKRTEGVAMIGTAGFLGLMCGSQTADFISGLIDSDNRYRVLFAISAVLCALYGVIVFQLTRHDEAPPPERGPSAWDLLLRHWPGAVVVPALMMGGGFACTSVFLTRFTTDRGLHGIGVFFTSYAVSAFLTRLITRTWPSRFGRHRLIIAGCTSQMMGFFLFPFVSSEWMLVGPALGIGFGHAVLFPAVVSLGTGHFPKEARNTGTMLTMGFFDLGSLIAAPLLGATIESFGFEVMFWLVSAGFLTVGLTYATMTRGEVDGHVTGR